MKNRNTVTKQTEVNVELSAILVQQILLDWYEFSVIQVSQSGEQKNTCRVWSDTKKRIRDGMIAQVIEYIE